jgi:hypothetical protein
MSGYPPSLTYLGQSPSNHPIVRTTAGELEILSRGWFNGRTEEYIVDDRSWKVAGYLMDSDSGPTVVSSATDLGIWDESRKLCVSAVINPRRRLSLLHDGCALHRAPPSPRDIAERRRKFAENIKTVAWQTPGKFVRWLDAWNRAVRTGLSTQFIYDINSPYVPLAQQLEINPNLFSNTTPAPIALGRVRRLLPHAANGEMGDDGTVSDFFGGAGAGISISRIGKSHTLIITVDYDDC